MIIVSALLEAQQTASTDGSFDDVMRHQPRHKSLEEIAGEARLAAVTVRALDYCRVDYEPGNATRYEIVIVNSSRTKDSFVVALPSFGASGRISKEGDYHPSYVAEKLQLRVMDAMEVALFLTLFSAAFEDISSAPGAAK